MSEKLPRSLIRECPAKIGQKVRLLGWVQTVRAHGKIAFFDLRDRSGLLQIGAFDAKLAKKVATLGAQDVVEVEGSVQNRETRYINKDQKFGAIELSASRVNIVHKSEEMPFDMGGKELHLELPTLLDYRSLTLKHETLRMIFTVQAALAQAFRELAQKLDCIEIFVPTIAAGATEGGAEVFPVDYYGHRAFLTQSPQLYKQIMVGVFERVFTISKAYRAEPSVTTRHLSESTQMDIEMGFIDPSADGFLELLDALEFVGTGMIAFILRNHADILRTFRVEDILIPARVPRLTLREAQAIITQRTGRDLSKEMDLNPEDEKEICEWAREEHASDFVTITHFPTKKRAFYTMPDPKNPEYSLSYDLLFRGLEVLSGSQRIHDYDLLVSQMKEKGVNPESFGMYLMAFRYGMPPEGGFSFGLERLTMKVLNLHNIREASAFPRDMERVDERLSILYEKEKAEQDKSG